MRRRDFISYCAAGVISPVFPLVWKDKIQNKPWPPKDNRPWRKKWPKEGRIWDAMGGTYKNYSHDYGPGGLKFGGVQADLTEAIT